MARTFNEGLSHLTDRVLQSRSLKKAEDDSRLEDAVKLADLQSKGFNVNETQTPRKLFGVIPAGNQRSLSLSRNNSPLPPGFVLINGKPEKDPAYLNPLEKTRMDSLKAGTSMFNPTTGEDSSNPGGLPPLEKLSPETQSLIKGITDYEIDPTKSSSVRNNSRQQLITAAKHYDPTYDMTQFPTRSAYRNEFSKGKIGSNVRSFNTAIQHLSELNDATGEVPSNPIQLIERGQRSFAKQFAGDSPTSLAMSKEDTALKAVAGELANIFKNSGGTDQEIGNFLSAYNPNSTKESKRQFIKTGIELMKGRLSALDSDYERVMGKKNTNPLISKESEAAMQRIGGGNNSFNSPEEADAAGLPPGSVVSIQGRKYQI